MDIFLGILVGLFGLGIAFAGLQVFFLTLPFLGFFFGFFVGAAGWEAIFGDGFLSTVTGWIVGAVVGVVFALISWFWWYAGVLLAAGAWGAALGTGIVEAFGGDSEWLLFFAALIGFIAIIAVTWFLNLPIYLIIVNTAFAGATLLITGILLIFNQVDYEELGYGTAVAIIEESWWWVLVWAVVSGFGIVFQLAMRAAVQLPEERWVNATSGPGYPLSSGR